MCEEAYRCKAITDKLLALARPGDESRGPVSLAALAADVITLVEGLPALRDRTLTLDAYKTARDAIERRCKGIAAANGCTLNFEIESGYPPTVNDHAMADYVAKVARETLGAASFIPVARPSMGGEDFAYYLQQIPGCFFLVGVEPPDQKTYPGLHSDRYDFTDAALAVGMRMFVELVLNWKCG